jgi:hypothetical protein
VASDFAVKKQKGDQTGLRPSEMRPKTNYDEAKWRRATEFRLVPTVRKFNVNPWLKFVLERILLCEIKLFVCRWLRAYLTVYWIFMLKTYTKSNKQNLTCNFGKITSNRFNFMALFVTSYRYMFLKCNELLLSILKNVTITCN